MGNPTVVPFSPAKVILQFVLGGLGPGEEDVVTKPYNSHA